MSRATPQFWRVRGTFADGSRLNEVVYAAGNVMAEAEACRLAGRSVDDLIGGSAMHISTGPVPLLVQRMPAVEFPDAAEAAEGAPTLGCQGPGCHQGRQPQACDCHLAQLGQPAADDAQAQAWAREEANSRQAKRAGQLLIAIGLVLACAALAHAVAELPYSPAVASVMAQVMP